MNQNTAADFVLFWIEYSLSCCPLLLRALGGIGLPDIETTHPIPTFALGNFRFLIQREELQ